MSQHPSPPGNGPPALVTRRSIRRHMTWNTKLSTDLVAALWESPEDLLRQGRCLQTKSRTTVARIDFPSGSYLLKFHHWAGAWKTLSKSLATSPNRRSFDDGLKLASRGLATPLPLACVDVRLGPLNVCSYLLTEFVSGSSLYRTMRYKSPDSTAIDHVSCQIADIWQLLDELQFCHNDLKPENLMIDDSDRVWLIDLENGRWARDEQSLRLGQIEDAKRLLHPRSWRTNPKAAEQLRQHLLTTPAAQKLIEHSGNRPHPLEPGIANVDSSPRLTVFIPCHDAVQDIRGCIESVRDFADEILVIGGGSQDETWELVRTLNGCRAIRRDTSGADPLCHALAEATHPWVLMIEPSERVSADLAKEIQCVLSGNPTSDGFQIERRCHIFGHIIRFGNSAGETMVRLVRKDGSAQLEPRPGDGSNQPKNIAKLRSTIDSRIWKIEQLTAALMQSANDEAEKLQSTGRRASFAGVLFHAPLNFVKSYFIKLGCLDGWAGLHLATLSAMFVYVSYVRLWQLQHELPHPDDDAQEPILKLAHTDDEPDLPRRKAV